MDKIQGKVSADIIDVRFAFAGKIASVNKKPGDTVKKGDPLASLDRRELQIILDKELADYEKVRAEFEIFGLDNPHPADDRTKFEKVRVQALLNASVKAVELAKLNLDSATLFSPVSGIVLDHDNIRTGMHITPGSYSYKILDLDSLVVVVDQDKPGSLLPDAKVKIKAGDREIEGTVLPPIPDPKGDSLQRIRPDNSETLPLGNQVEIL